MTPVFLIGYRCTGKTTVGRRLAKILDRPFVDTDAVLESRFEVSIADMVEQNGWDYFRQKESRVLEDLDLGAAPVVATGGGIVLSEANRNFMAKSGYCVWLYADESTIVRRLVLDAGTTDHRPALTKEGIETETRKILAARDPLYRSLARVTINTADHSPEAAALMIKQMIED